MTEPYSDEELALLREDVEYVVDSDSWLSVTDRLLATIAERDAELAALRSQAAAAVPNAFKAADEEQELRLAIAAAEEARDAALAEVARLRAERAP